MNRLKQLRKEKNLSLAELSEKINYSASQINRVERGESTFTGNQVVTIANFFNVSSDYLLGISNIKKCETKNYYYKNIKLSLTEILDQYINKTITIKNEVDKITIVDLESMKAEIYIKI